MINYTLRQDSIDKLLNKGEIKRSDMFERNGVIYRYCIDCEVYKPATLFYGTRARCSACYRAKYKRKDRLEIPVYMVDGRRFIIIKDFARIINRGVTAVRRNIEQGNRIRRLVHTRVGRDYLILYDELFVYPFTNSGRNSKEVYHYDENLKLTVCTECTEGKRCPKVDDKGEYINVTVS